MISDSFINVPFRETNVIMDKINVHPSHQEDYLSPGELLEKIEKMMAMGIIPRRKEVVAPVPMVVVDKNVTDIANLKDLEDDLKDFPDEEEIHFEPIAAGKEALKMCDWKVVSSPLRLKDEDFNNDSSLSTVSSWVESSMSLSDHKEDKKKAKVKAAAAVVEEGDDEYDASNSSGSDSDMDAFPSEALEKEFQAARGNKVEKAHPPEKIKVQKKASQLNAIAAGVAGPSSAALFLSNKYVNKSHAKLSNPPPVENDSSDDSFELAIAAGLAASLKDKEKMKLMEKPAASKTQQNPTTSQAAKKQQKEVFDWDAMIKEAEILQNNTSEPEAAVVSAPPAPVASAPQAPAVRQVFDLSEIRRQAEQLQLDLQKKTPKQEVVPKTLDIDELIKQAEVFSSEELLPFHY